VNQHVHYFAYGSNMSLRRLQARTPGARPLGMASLPRHELRFHKRSDDGSGKCDAYYVGDSAASLPGVLYHLPLAQKPELDRVEGVGYGYSEKTVRVRCQDDSWVTAVTYHAIDIRAGLKPYDWYRHHVVTGAREFGLPQSYIDWIMAVQTVQDEDAGRRAREQAIYGQALVADTGLRP
jgi:hypothetical protein